MMQKSSALARAIFDLFAGLAAALARLPDALQREVLRLVEAWKRLQAGPEGQERQRKRESMDAAMIVVRPTPFELAETYRAFWAEEQAAAERRMEDRAVLELALSSMAAETQRQLPIRWQVSIYDALREAETAKSGILFEQSRRAGSADKTDALQAFIIDAVRANRSITLAQLLDRLRQQRQPGGWLEDIDQETIWFLDGKRGSKSASVSGLKDRLCRARKKIDATESR